MSPASPKATISEATQRELKSETSFSAEPNRGAKCGPIVSYDVIVKRVGETIGHPNLCQQADPNALWLPCSDERAEVYA